MTIVESAVTLVTADDVFAEARLEAAVRSPEAPKAFVVATHPHPLYGGDMHNTAPAAIARVLPEKGIGVLRFNFRGVGASTGAHGEGKAEVADVAAALDWVSTEHPGVPVFLAGYSFGADVALSTVHPALSGWFAIAAPLRIFDAFAAADDPRSKMLAVPAHDQYRDPASAETFTSDWANTAQVTLPGCDHFLAGAAQRITDQLTGWVNGLVSSK